MGKYIINLLCQPMYIVIHTTQKSFQHQKVGQLPDCADLSTLSTGLSTELGKKKNGLNPKPEKNVIGLH